MILFDDNELEVALVTYNRCPFVKEWLSICHKELEKRNITISIVESDRSP